MAEGDGLRGGRGKEAQGSQTRWTRRGGCKEPSGRGAGAGLEVAEKSCIGKNLACGTIQKILQGSGPLIHLPIHPGTHLSTHLPTHPCIRLSMYSSVRMFIHASIHPCVQPRIHPSVHPYIHTSTHACTHPSTHPPIRPSTHLHIHPPAHAAMHQPSHHTPLHPPIHLSICICLLTNILCSIFSMIHSQLLASEKQFLLRLTENPALACRGRCPSSDAERAGRATPVCRQPPAASQE